MTLTAFYGKMFANTISQVTAKQAFDGKVWL